MYNLYSTNETSFKFLSSVWFYPSDFKSSGLAHGDFCNKPIATVVLNIPI